MYLELKKKKLSYDKENKCTEWILNYEPLLRKQAVGMQAVDQVGLEVPHFADLHNVDND